MKKQLLILITLFISIVGYSQTFTDNNFITYTVIPSSTNVEVTGYDASNGGTNVNIPDTIDYNSTTYSITKIGSAAFNGKGLTSVTFTLPSNITIINIGAFLQNSLTSIVIPDSVTFIGNQSFKSNQITSVVIPSGAVAGYESFKDNAISNLSISIGVSSINPNAFENNLLSSITIPNSVTFIGSNAFNGNPLTTVASLATTPPSITTGTNDTFGSNRNNIDLDIPVGTMDIYVTNPNTGADWTGFNSVTEGALSISDFELDNNIKTIISSERIEIISNNSIRLKNYTLYSITGSKVAAGTESEISTSFLANGIYVLKMSFDKGTVHKKIAVK